MTVLEHHRTAAALHIAKVELRERERGNHYDADRAHDRLVDTVEASRWPRTLLFGVARRLGRERALAVGIDRDTVELAVRL